MEKVPTQIKLPLNNELAMVRKAVLMNEKMIILVGTILTLLDKFSIMYFLMYFLIE